MGLFGRKRQDPSIASLDRAVPASAIVVSARQMTRTSQEVNSSSEVYLVELDVERPGTDVVRRTVQWTVFDIALADIRSGSALAVTVDPDRPNIVYPPGYPPPGFKPGLISLGDARMLPTSAWLDEQLERTQ